MELPNVVHPKRFLISEVQIQVITYFPITDHQAALIAMHLWRTQAKVRKAKKKLIQIPWIGDQSALALLEAMATGGR